MNQSHYTYKVNGTMHSEWADAWSDIKAKFPTALLVNQIS